MERGRVLQCLPQWGIDLVRVWVKCAWAGLVLRRCTGEGRAGLGRALSTCKCFREGSMQYLSSGREQRGVMKMTKRG